jgi:hypothetical protein
MVGSAALPQCPVLSAWLPATLLGWGGVSHDRGPGPVGAGWGWEGAGRVAGDAEESRFAASGFWGFSPDLAGGPLERYSVGKGFGEFSSAGRPGWRASVPLLTLITLFYSGNAALVTLGVVQVMLQKRYMCNDGALQDG